jgi:hypothetical protein
MAGRVGGMIAGDCLGWAVDGALPPVPVAATGPVSRLLGMTTRTGSTVMI